MENERPLVNGLSVESEPPTPLPPSIVKQLSLPPVTRNDPIVRPPHENTENGVHGAVQINYASFENDRSDTVTPEAPRRVDEDGEEEEQEDREKEKGKGKIPDPADIDMDERSLDIALTYAMAKFPEKTIAVCERLEIAYPPPLHRMKKDEKERLLGLFKMDIGIKTYSLIIDLVKDGVPRIAEKFAQLLGVDIEGYSKLCQEDEEYQQIMDELALDYIRAVNIDARVKFSFYMIKQGLIVYKQNQGYKTYRAAMDKVDSEERERKRKAEREAREYDPNKRPRVESEVHRNGERLTTRADKGEDLECYESLDEDDEEDGSDDDFDEREKLKD